MTARLSPMEFVNLALRNVVPIVGLLFFHWSAANLLILYFVDTLLAFAVIIGGFLYSQFPSEEAPGLAARINTIAGYAFGAFAVVLILALPLGMPIFILVFGVADASITDMLRDRGFELGLGLQAIASLVSFRDLVVALRSHTIEELGLKRRFTFVMLRWIGTMMAAYFPLTSILGRFAPFVLVAVYIGLTIFAEVMPDRFLASFGGMARDIEDAGAAGGTDALSRERRAPPRSTPPRRGRDARR